jgi:hypothetical protein
MLGLVVPDDEFATMVADANRLRAAVRRLGTSGSDIDSNVRARLYWNPKVPDVPEVRKDSPTRSTRSSTARGSHLRRRLNSSASTSPRAGIPEPA